MYSELQAAFAAFKVLDQMDSAEHKSYPAACEAFEVLDTNSEEYMSLMQAAFDALEVGEDIINKVDDEPGCLNAQPTQGQQDKLDNATEVEIERGHNNQSSGTKVILLNCTIILSLLFHCQARSVIQTTSLATSILELPIETA